VLTKIKSLGPGLLYAGAAIGVSHLVQSTKAGAYYGFILIIAIVIAHFFKYPFLAMGSRYAHLANESLVMGYKRVGNWAVWLLLAITILTMFSVQAAVTIVTAGLAQELTGIVLAPWLWSAILLIVCFLLLNWGKFQLLDSLIKVIMVVLAISTVVAFFTSFSIDKVVVQTPGFNLFQSTDLIFLIAFLGWMPAPLDITIWQSIWTVRKDKLNKRSLADVKFDFNVGFYGTALLAICFLSLGANIIYGTEVSVESSAGAFASQLVGLFTQSLGNWSYYIILIAAFTTMFSTTLTCLDALPSMCQEIGTALNLQPRINKRWIWMALVAVGALIILYFFIASMAQMVFVATVVSFLTAPVLAFLSILLYKHKLPMFSIWSKKELYLAYAGLGFLVLFSVLYLIQFL
jgi:Mn2+/Fe2+ NRAMP family transporter